VKKNGPKNGSVILDSHDLQLIHKPTRRDFLQQAAGAASLLYFGALTTGCGGGSGSTTPSYVIDAAARTSERVLAFPMRPLITKPNSGVGLCPLELSQISQYSKYNYGKYTYSSTGLAIAPRYDIMSASYSGSVPAHLKKFANFFTFTDIHITDKESPNKLIAIQQADPTFGAPMTSIYSPVMLYSTQVLDAAVQTVNALHEKTPFDFGISLGDAINTSQYNELRWYIDVLDGKRITPSSGAHRGAADIDYQKPFKAAGLHPDIPWYQTLGNHDHFYIGSIPVDAASLNIRESYTSNKVWRVGDVLQPNSMKTFPCLYDTFASLSAATYYGGVIDGATANGDIIDSGDPAAFSTPPVVVADKNRRPVLRAEWIDQFFNTTSKPVGHGFNLVDPAMGSDFACYSFVPKSDIPLKVIVLDNTQDEKDGSHDIHGHGFLDAKRWQWLKTELAAGQANNQLMIIAAHIPIGVAAIGSEMEWWEPINASGNKDPNATMNNAVNLAGLVSTLQSYPNLILWAAGHRHLNTVKAFKSPVEATPELGFWQVETSSLRDFPQQFRTFEIYLNADYTISIVTTNVDPSVADGSPAATSRAYSIATQQIAQTNLLANSKNVASMYGMPVSSLDPSRPQDGTADSSILYASVPGVDYCASYNAELYVQLSSTMVNVMKQKFPTSAK